MSWHDYSVAISCVYPAFHYIGSVLQKPPFNKMQPQLDLATLGYAIWRDKVFASVKPMLLDAIFRFAALPMRPFGDSQTDIRQCTHAPSVTPAYREVESDRGGHTCRSRYIKETTESFRKLESASRMSDLYDTEFQLPFLMYTRTYYQSRVAEIATQLDPRAYILSVANWLDMESDRCARLFCDTTGKVVISACEDIMIREQLPILIAEGQRMICHDDIDGMRYDDAIGSRRGASVVMIPAAVLDSLYHLLQRVGMQGPLAECLERHIKSVGTALVCARRGDGRADGDFPPQRPPAPPG